MGTVLWILIWAVGWCILHYFVIAVEPTPPSDWDEDKRLKHVFLPCLSWVLIAIIAALCIIGGACWCIWWLWTHSFGKTWQDFELWLWSKTRTKSELEDS